MKKKIFSVVTALALTMTFSAGMTANAYSFMSDSGIKSYEHNSDEVDWSLWNNFLKYDLRITDFNSLDSEKQKLCRYIYETEMLSKETIVCERARRIVADEEVGERLTIILFASEFEYRTIKYNGFSFKVYLGNTLCLASIDSDIRSNVQNPIYTGRNKQYARNKNSKQCI